MNSFSLTQYNRLGEPAGAQSVSVDQLDGDVLAQFAKKLSRLSGDLELPLEAKLPSRTLSDGLNDELHDGPPVEYRVGSDRHGAYVLFYLHDEVVFASLYLRGEDEASETELTQVFKFLLLDTEDDDEPSEEEIEAVLALEAFDFEAVRERPAAFAVKFSERPEEEADLRHVEAMNQHLAAAFFGLK